MGRIIEAASVGNLLHAWPFRYEVSGYNLFLVKKAKLPGVEFEVVELSSGGQTYAVKQAGGGKITEYTLDIVVPATGPERMFWEDWRDLVETRDISKYYKDAALTLLGPNNQPAVIWDGEDNWPSKPFDFEEFDSDDKKKLVIAKVTMQCNYFKMRAK